MPFVADRRLEDLLDPAAGGRAARRIAEAGTERLVENTRRNTPIDTSPGSQAPLTGTWWSRSHEKVPAELKDAVQVA